MLTNFSITRVRVLLLFVLSLQLTYLLIYFLLIFPTKISESRWNACSPLTEIWKHYEWIIWANRWISFQTPANVVKNKMAIFISGIPRGLIIRVEHPQYISCTMFYFCIRTVRNISSHHKTILRTPLMFLCCLIKLSLSSNLLPAYAVRKCNLS